MKWVVVFFALLLAGCGLSERDDFLIGRSCVSASELPCDEGQRCLPHSLNGGSFGEFRCRDFDSFQQVAGLAKPPLAYCNAEHRCPEGLVCRPDRIRVDGGPRPNVCKSPDDVFIPPNFDAGVNGGN